LLALALDFDGVICDSAAEIRATALDAWAGLFPASDLSPRMQHNPRMNDELTRLIPLGNRAEDFGVALHILDESMQVSNQSDYDRVRCSLGRTWLERFHRAFYAARHRRREAAPQSWFDLHTTYEPFVEVLRRRHGEVPFAIVTAKDRTSVAMLLEQFGCSTLFPPDLILDKQTGVRKTAHLKALAERLRISVATITFVDDKVNHLAATAPLGIRPVLAGWGHNTRREHDEARAAGFAVAQLDTAETVIFDS